MKPNKLLKRAREQRGWSQAKLAELVGTTSATIGRWERGSSVPYPVHREKLCELFALDTRALGLIEDDSAVEPTPQAPIPTLPGHQAPVPAPQPFIFDPAIPMLPVEVDMLVGRDDLLAKLKRRLFTAEAPDLHVLSGLPGVGKTTLALTLAYDHMLQAHFSDGILWAGLGTQPAVEEIQARWGTQLGLSQVEAMNIKSRDDWARLLHALLGLRRMLLIVDDVWNTDDALAFQVGGPHCVYLFTTRFPQIAMQIASRKALSVSELSEEGGVELLAHFVPQLVEQNGAMARQLVNSVGALPLALVLMGRYLRSHVYNEQPRRLHKALQNLSETERRLHLSDTHGLSRPYSNYASRTNSSLQSVISLSDEQLDVPARKMLHALAVFPPKPNTFSEQAATAISALPAEALDTLCDFGLLETSSPERYTLHQTIADYAYTQMAESETPLFERMIAYMVHYIEIHKNDYLDLVLEHDNILAALEAASQRGMDTEFVRGVTALAPFQRIRGLHTEAVRYLKRAYQIAQKLDDYSAQMELLSQLAQSLELLSEYKQAERYSSEGLQMARLHKQTHFICLFLVHLGVVMEKLGDYRQAENALQEGLSLARKLDLPERICYALIALGWIFTNQGKLTEAQTALSEALQLARQLEHKEYIVRILTQFGIIAIGKEDYALARTSFLEALAKAYQIGYRDRAIRLLTNLSGAVGSVGDYKQAESYLQEGLRLAQQIDNRESKAMLLNNLGSLAWLQGRYDQAQTYLQEGLSIAQQINHPRLIANILYEQGEVALSARHYNVAQLLFKEAITSASAFPEIRANAHYGLARTLVILGNSAEARYNGEASAQLFETSGLPKATTVRNWLATLSE